MFAQNHLDVEITAVSRSSCTLNFTDTCRQIVKTLKKLYVQYSVLNRIFYTDIELRIHLQTDKNYQHL